MKFKNKIIALVASGTMLMNVLGAYANVPTIDEAWNQLSSSQQSKLGQVGIDPATLNQIDALIGSSDVTGVIYPPLKYENDQFIVSQENSKKAFDILEIFGMVPGGGYNRDNMLLIFNDVIADINRNSSTATKQDFSKLLGKYGFVTVGGPVVPVVPGGGGPLPLAPEQIKGSLELIQENLQKVDKPSKIQAANIQQNLEALSTRMIDPLTSLSPESVQKAWEQSAKWQEENAKGMVFNKASAPVASWNLVNNPEITIPKGLWEKASDYSRLELDAGSVLLTIEKNTYSNDGGKLSFQAVNIAGVGQGAKLASTGRLYSPAKISFYVEDEKAKDYGVYKIEEDKKEVLIGGIYNPARGTVEALVKSSGTYVLKEAPAKLYTDLINVDWAKEEIQHLAQKGYISGKAEGVYGPKDQITRAEFAVLLTRILQLPGTKTPSKFGDMTSGAWYYNDVMATVEAGLFNGKSATSFDPDGKITRQETAAVISRILVQKGYSEPKLEVEEKGLWAPGAIALMKTQELTTQIPNFNSSLRENANRAEVAYILYNLLQR